MVIIRNKANTVELDFNDYAAVFEAAKISIDKGSGNRLYLSANKTYIELIYSADGEKVVLDSGTYPIFEKEDSTSFASMESLYDYLVSCMDDRTGTI